MAAQLSSRDRWHVSRAARCIATGGLVAYPTEAVYGLGCHPLDGDAVSRLLEVKQRPMDKGLILIAAHWSQLAPYLLPLTPSQTRRVQASWPGPTTWVIPCRADVPRWLRGDHDSLAVRMTDHPLAAALCAHSGTALISTSANLSGRPACRTPLQVRIQFGTRIDYLLNGRLGGLARPTTIRELRTGRTLRSA